MQPSQKYRLEDFTLEEKLGEGSFAVVFLATGPQEERVALKQYKKCKSTQNYFRREVDASRVPDHPGLLRLLGHYETAQHYYLMHEFFAGRDLGRELEHLQFCLSEGEVKDIFRQIVEVVVHCHKNGVAHRDLKLENVLINRRREIALIDFGFSTFMDGPEKLHTDAMGSKEYAAPELLRRLPYQSFKADCYSAGVLLYCLLFAQFPFTIPQLEESLQEGELPPLKFPKPISESAKDLLSKMLELEPEERISLRDVLNHDWMLTECLPEESSEDASSGKESPTGLASAC
jgi:serine/threonine protein kinase